MTEKAEDLRFSSTISSAKLVEIGRKRRGVVGIGYQVRDGGAISLSEFWKQLGALVLVSSRFSFHSRRHLGRTPTEQPDLKRSPKLFSQKKEARDRSDIMISPEPW